VKRFLSTNLLDSFVQRTSEAMSDRRPCSSPCCEFLGRAWQQLGLRPGDIVLLCLPNGRDLLNQFFGVLMAGGVPALVAPLTPVARLREIALVMGARAIGAFRLPAGELGASAYEVIGPIQVAMLPPTPEPSAAPGEAIVLTSGTSGFASGCVFDFEALLLNGKRHAESIGQRKEDVVLVSLPLHFSFALVAQALASLVCGNRLVISGPPFNLSLYSRTLHEYGVTISSLTPVLIRSLLHADVNFLSELRVLTVGGDALEPDLVARLVEYRRGADLYLTYGLTQAGPRVSTLAAHAETSRRYGSVGRPIEGTATFLRPTADGSGRKQLYVTSESVMKRPVGRVDGRLYHGLVGPQTIATGDAFEQDEQGYLFFKGRLCDFISRDGVKISLAGVRRAARQLSHVLSAKTTVIQYEDGSEDFDLELGLDSCANPAMDAREMLRGLLIRGEMPRSIHVESTNGIEAHPYK
jgi:acyl-CoA synthetase (AMP-forming)/AMP-acid ligase II